jgi:hypothetical protein
MCDPLRGGYKAVTVDQWRDQAFKEGFRHGLKSKSRQGAFRKIRENMQVAGDISISDDWVWLLTPVK